MMKRHIQSKKHCQHIMIERAWTQGLQLLTGEAGELNRLEEHINSLKGRGNGKADVAKGKVAKGKVAKGKGEGKIAKGKGVKGVKG